MVAGSPQIETRLLYPQRTLELQLVQLNIAGSQGGPTPLYRRACPGFPLWFRYKNIDGLSQLSYQIRVQNDCYSRMVISTAKQLLKVFDFASNLIMKNYSLQYLHQNKLTSTTRKKQEIQSIQREECILYIIVSLNVKIFSNFIVNLIKMYMIMQY